MKPSGFFNVMNGWCWAFSCGLPNPNESEKRVNPVRVMSIHIFAKDVKMFF